MDDTRKHTRSNLATQSLRMVFFGTSMIAIVLILGGLIASREHYAQSNQERIAGATNAHLKTNQPTEILPASSESISMLFVGDLMFDRGIRQIAAYRGYEIYTAAIVELGKDVDVVVGNLEGPITDYPSKSIMTNAQDGRDHFTFTFAPMVADLLATSGVRVVSLANNHASDFGPDGVMQTRHALTKAGIAYFGDPTDPAHHAYTIEQGGVTITLVGYNQFGLPNEEDVVRAIIEARIKSDLVIVMPHWGEEYTQVITHEQRRLAHRFVEAGADMIVGSHPHVIQVSEVYQDAPIFYSLGNAIFDQWFSSEVSCGMALSISFSSEAGLDISERRMWSTSRGTRVLDQCPQET